MPPSIPGNACLAQESGLAFHPQEHLSSTGVRLDADEVDAFARGLSLRGRPELCAILGPLREGCLKEPGLRSCTHLQVAVSVIRYITRLRSSGA